MKVKLCILFLYLLPLSGNSVPAVRHDPTEPAVLPTTAAANKPTPVMGYELQSILVDGKRKLALINSKFVTEGEIIDNAKVMKINTNSVILSTQGQKITLYLFKGIRE